MGVRNGCCGTDKTDSDAADKVCETNRQSCPEQCVSCQSKCGTKKKDEGRRTGKVVVGRVIDDVFELCAKDNGDNKAVYGNGLTKQNADQVLARNPRRRDRSPDQ